MATNHYLCISILLLLSSFVVTGGQSCNFESKLGKRALDKDIDLNLPALEESDFSIKYHDSSSKPVHETNKKRKKVPQTREERLEKTKLRVRQRRQEIKQIASDPNDSEEKRKTLALLARQKELKKKASKKWDTTLRLAILDGSATDYQKKLWANRIRGKSSREGNPEKEKVFEEYKKRRRERYNERQKALKLQSEQGQQSTPPLQKRALQEESVDDRSPPIPPYVLKSNSSRMTKPKTRNKVKFSPEEAKRRTHLSKMAYNNRIRAQAKEARKNPKKMTPKIQEYLKGVKRSSKKHYKNMNEAIKQGTATAHQKEMHDKHLRNSNWRSASFENELLYQQHLLRNRERSRKNGNKTIVTQEIKPDQPKLEPWSKKRKRTRRIDLNQPAKET